MTIISPDIMSQTLTGGCLCGKCRYSLDIPSPELPLKALFCHCNRCRHISGVLFASVAVLPSSSRPSQAVLDTLRQYKSSEGMTRYFCGTCGCHVFINGHSRDMWFVSTGTLEKLDGNVDVLGHIFLEDTHDSGASDWLVEINGNKLKRWAQTAGSPELPVGWHSTEPKATTSASPSDRLHAHCDCKGVTFYISRPHPQIKNTQTPTEPQQQQQQPPPAQEQWWLRAHGRKYLADNCSCDSCRLVTGYDIQHWAYIPTPAISLSPDGAEPFSREFGTLRSYRSSDKATRMFCSVCGATVFFDGDARYEESPVVIDVSVGLLDAEEGARAESWLGWVTDGHSYPEDGMKRAKALTLALDAGLRAWGQGREG